MTRLVWVRHGPTHASEMIGWTDRAADLSDRAAIARLAAALPRNAGYVSSDLRRAVATADALLAACPPSAAPTRLPHDAGFREIHFGAWEGRSHADVDAENPARLRAFWENAGAVRAPGGESWDDLCARIHAATDALLAAHPGRDLVIVAHFGVILAALQRALGLGVQEVFAHHIEPLSLTEMDWQPTGWRVGRVNYRP